MEYSTDEDEDWAYLTLRDAVDKMEERMGIRTRSDWILDALGYRTYRPARDELLKIHLEDVAEALWLRHEREGTATRTPDLPSSSAPLDDAPAPPDPDPADDDSPEPPPAPPETAQEPLPEVPGEDPEERGSAVTDFLAEAAAGGPNRADEMKAFIADMNKVVAAGERKLFGIRVVVIVDNKVVSGDVEEAIRGFYHHVVNDARFNFVEDNSAIFIDLCVAAFGDNEAVRKAAKAVYDKKGA